MQGYKSGNGENCPPHTGRAHADADSHALAHTDPSGSQIQNEVEGQEESAPEISDSPAPGRYCVAIFRRSDLREERVIDHDRSAESDVRNQKQRSAKQVRASLEEKHRDGGCSAKIRSDREDLFLAAAMIRDCAYYGQYEDLQNNRQAYQVTPVAPSVDRNTERIDVASWIGGGLCYRCYVGTQEQRDYRGG